jgi:methyltransferase (TIGR00027 family)
MKVNMHLVLFANMTIDTKPINDVTDTALWVAAYRAEESRRKDAFFNDPYAALLVGEEGIKIATHTQGSRYTAWSVVIRTVIIDRFINKLLNEGIDTVLNLGAGLDTRPYRMNLSPQLKWIEVDFPNIIQLKEERLRFETPRCQLQRFSMDLSVEQLRTEFLAKINSESKNVLVLTEGVVPYLTNEEAKSLALDLHANKNFSHWINEYYSPEILAFLRTPKRLKQMENSPFQFYPEHWFHFYENNGWNELETLFFGIESEKLGRTSPTPGWLKNETDAEKIQGVKKYLGYSLYRNKV